MSTNLLDYLAWQERTEDLVREADRARLVKQMKRGQGRRTRFYSRALAWLGHRLVAWGRRLQEFDGAATAVPALRVADQRR